VVNLAFMVEPRNVKNLVKFVEKLSSLLISRIIGVSYHNGEVNYAPTHTSQVHLVKGVRLC